MNISPPEHLINADSLASQVDSEGVTELTSVVGSMNHHDVDFVESQVSTLPRSSTNSSSCVPSHYDPLHPVVLANNTFSDTLVYATLISEVFNLPVKNCIAAGIVGNVMGAIATSPYVSNKIMELLPNDQTRDVARQVDAVVRKFIDPGYFTYYATAWPALGVATIPEACCFILASALMRKGASLLLQSEACKGSLERQAQALAPTDQILEPSLNALMRVMREFTPDLVASLSRSGISNVYSCHQGKSSAKDILQKTLFSSAIYVTSTFLYYACYRILEQVGTRHGGMYKEAAAMDQGKIEEVKENLINMEPHANTQEDRSSLEEEGRPLFSSSKSYSPVSRAQMQALSQGFQVLKSPLVSLFKDPLYRTFIALTYQYNKNDPDSKNAIEAFRAIDNAELLNKVVATFEGDEIKEEQINAYKTLLGHLGIQIPSGELSPEDIATIQQKGLNALIQTFKAHSTDTGPQQGNSSLLQVAQKGYGAISS